MKVSYAGKFFFGIFLPCIVFSLVALTGCAGKPVSATTSAKIKIEKEMLVARDVILDEPIWCGRTNALVYIANDVGIFWHDIETGNKVQVTNWRSFPIACTPDGKWVMYREFLYVDGYDVETNGAVKHGSWDDELGDIFDYPVMSEAERPIVEVWRYEVETGRRQRFAVIFEGEERGVAIDDSSPEGIKIYLGQEPATKVKMPEPKWEIVWSLHKQTNMEVWLNDFSAVAGYYWDFEFKRMALEVEVFSPRRKVFVVYPEAHYFFPLIADRKGRVFIRKERLTMEGEERQNEAIERCDIDIDKEAISCVQVLEIEGGEERPDPCPQCPLPPVSTGTSINSIDVFSDDETMLIAAEGDECVRIMRIGEKEAGCLTDSRYEVGIDVVISPDERWVAYIVARRVAEGEIKTIQNYTNDIYIVRVKKD